ncbi:MAG TPA: NUDIX hydrolase, partial [Blastocatellia bacterium]|nr:NUDIX hydrolase [Blastocatellia bacterium]
MKSLIALAFLSFLLANVLAQNVSKKPSGPLPEGYWPLEKSQPIIDKTQVIKLAPDLSHLSEAERRAIGKLLEVGKIFQALYESQRHAQALSSISKLEQLDKQMGSTAATENLLALYRLNQGPIATTLENNREPFLPVDPTQPGKNLYPWGVTK